METKIANGDDLSPMMGRTRISRSPLQNSQSPRTVKELHDGQLEAAKAYHENIRLCAEQVLQADICRKETERARAFADLEERRVQAESERIKEETRLERIESQRLENERLERQKIEAQRNTPRLPTPPPSTPPRSRSQVQQPAPAPPVSRQESQPQKPTLPPPAPVVQLPKNPFQQAPTILPPTSQPPAAPQQTQQPIFNAAKQAAPPPTAAQPPAQNGAVQPPAQADHLLPNTEEYLRIIQNLKQMKAQITRDFTQNVAWRKEIGFVRRFVAGQAGKLIHNEGPRTSERQKNNADLIMEVRDKLIAARQSTQGSRVDPGLFLVSTTSPALATSFDQDDIPIVFIYLLNELTKGIMKHFRQDCRTTPVLADYVGLLVAKIFSDPMLKWRQASFIDIFMARMRKLIPTCFGVRGNDRTEEGRRRIGYAKSSGEWLNEQTHMDYMTGLARGYAAVSLRAFGKRTDNPWPPYHYWMTLATILNTPPEQRTRTQYLIVGSLIDGHEGKFVTFYGSAGLALLRHALVEFPKNPKPEDLTYARTLATLGSTWEMNFGFSLA